MKKLAAMLLALLLAVAAGLAAAEGEQDALAKLKEKGTLVIGMEGNWSPWTYHDEKTGELTGLEVDIARLIAEGLGVEPVFQEAPWDALLAGVDAGRFDIICNGVGYTEERAKSYSFTTPYVYSNKVLVVAESNDEIKTVDDLKGKKTANSASSTYAALAEEYGATLVPVDTLGETMDMLVQGRVDATINAQVSIADYLREHPEAKIKVVQVLAGDPIAYPLHIGEKYQPLVDAINDILEAARQDGRLAEISMKYFGVDMTKAE
ncbi:MAG: transporter substrate-binding domain-containing protein [Clostridiales bacterium]|nr:transporter substrate-binding domain-containing protein [Clostridiales bacterium]